MSWRDMARPIIAAAIREGRAKALEGPALRKHVHTYYPFGERAMHPYKIWLDEMKQQLKDKTPPPKDLSNYWRDLAYPQPKGGGA